MASGKAVTALVKRLDSAEARLLFSLLVKEHPDLVDEVSLLQDVWLANWALAKGNIRLACEKSGVSYSQYRGWSQNEAFQAKKRFVCEMLAGELMEQAYAKAAKGDNEMLKFLLAGLNPEMWDSRVRAQKVAIEGQMELMRQGLKELSKQDIIDLIRNDPAEEFVDVIEAENVNS